MWDINCVKVVAQEKNYKALEERCATVAGYAKILKFYEKARRRHFFELRDVDDSELTEEAREAKRYHLMLVEIEQILKNKIEDRKKIEKIKNVLLRSEVSS